MTAVNARARVSASLRETPVGSGLARLRDLARGVRATTMRRPRTGRGAAVLLYHGVVPTLSDPFVEASHVDAQSFRSQIRHLKTHYRIVPLEQIVAALEAGDPIGDDWVALTFDDGYRNNLTCALEVLHDEGRLPMTLFVATDFVGTDRTLTTVALRMCLLHARATRLRIPTPGGDWVERPLEGRRQRVNAFWAAHAAIRPLAPDAQERVFAEFLEQLGEGEAEEIRRRFSSYDWLDWSELRELAGHGVEIASHGCSHVPMRADLGEAALTREIEVSRQRLREELGEVSDHFAYPFGGADDVSDEAERLLSNVGVRSALTTLPGTVHTGDDRYRLRRLVGCTGGMGTFRLANATGMA